MNQPVELNTEQRFDIRAFEVTIEPIQDVNQAKKLLVDLYTQMKVQEVLYKGLVKVNWGIGEPPKVGE